MDTILEEMGQVITVDPNTWKITAHGVFSNPDYIATIEPMFYDSTTGACCIYIPHAGSLGIVRRHCGSYVFHPAMTTNDSIGLNNVIGRVSPGDFLLLGPTGAGLQISGDTLTIGAGMGLVRSIFTGGSDSLTTMARKVVYTTSGANLEMGPVFPAMDTMPVPTRFDLSVSALSGMTEIPDINLQLGSTSVKGVILLITALASLTQILLRKTGELELQVKELKVGLVPKSLIYSDFLAHYLLHTHESAAPGEPTGAPLDLDSTTLNTLYSTKILKAE
jgi:hypothetical protein